MSRYLVVGLAVSFGLALSACDASVDIGVGTACVDDSECGDGSGVGSFYCDGDGACSELVATLDGSDCIDDTDCPDGTICDDVDGLCYDDTVVVVDTGDGGDGASCEDDNSCGVGDECVDDSDCLDGEFCDTDGTCNDAPTDGGNDCVDDTDCDGDLVCDAGVCG